MKIICPNQSLFSLEINELYYDYTINEVSEENDNHNRRFLKFKFDNLLINPHIEGLTKESMNKTDMCIYEKFSKKNEK
tara:strand:- start:1065 stop:1298 length:234 start_codon:yes stop_codon:yes gene_type:complete